jgi:hypothetical protein
MFFKKDSMLMVLIFATASDAVSSTGCSNGCDFLDRRCCSEEYITRYVLKKFFVVDVL